MNCSKYRLQIDTARDMDRLPPEAARHVAACTECERFGRELFGLRALLREPGRVSAPSDFDARLARRLREAKAAPAARSAWSWLLVPQTGLAAAAALVVVVAGGVAVTRLDQPAVAPNTNLSRPGYNARTEAPKQIATATSGATNRPTPEVAPPSTPAAPPSSVGSVKATVRTASYTPSRRANNAELDEPRQAARRDTMIFVRDAGGSRVVNVPKVLVGAEQIVPASASLDAVADAGEKVAF